MSCSVRKCCSAFFQKANKFQLFYATSSDGATALVVYLYADEDLNFASSVGNAYGSMGIKICPYNQNYSWFHPSSGTANIANDLVTGSNVNTPGMWMFLMKDSDIVHPGK